MFQHVVIVGNLGKDPDYNEAGEKTYCKFSVAVSDGFGENERTTWFNCTAFGKTATAIDKFVGKGDRVLVEGRIHTSTYTDNDGNKRSNWSLLADTVKFLTPKTERESGVEPDADAAAMGHDSATGFPW